MSELIPFIFIGLIAGFYAVTFWRFFEKAGEPGWTIFVPFYNLYRFVKIAGKPGWYALLYFVPVVNILVSLMVNIEIAKKFGKSEGFGIGLFFLDFIFYPILAFGDAVYEGGEKMNEMPVQNNENVFVNDKGETVEKIPLEDWK